MSMPAATTTTPAINAAEMLSRAVARICQLRYGALLPMHVSQEIDARLEEAHLAAGSRDARRMVNASISLAKIGNGKMRGGKK